MRIKNYVYIYMYKYFLKELEKTEPRRIKIESIKE